MPNDLRITVDELRQRMEAGERFTIIDSRNENAWAAAANMARGAIRMHGDKVSEKLSKIPPNEPVITYCT